MANAFPRLRGRRRGAAQRGETVMERRGVGGASPRRAASVAKGSSSSRGATVQTTRLRFHGGSGRREARQKRCASGAKCAARPKSKAPLERKDFRRFQLAMPDARKNVAPLVTLARSAPGSYRETFSHAALRAAAL